MTAKLPPIAELIPHAGDMVLLSEVLEHDESGTVCALEVGKGPFMEPDGRVSAWIGIEYMSQGVAAHGGLLAFAANESPRIGFLLGSRRVRLLRGHYEAGQRLITRAVPVWGREAGLVAFDCSLECASSGELFASGRLNCYLLKDGQFELEEGLQ